MRFIEINNDTTVNLNAVSKVERMVNGSLIYIDGIGILAEIPYDTMVSILTQESEEPRRIQPNIADSLNALIEYQTFTKP